MFARKPGKGITLEMYIRNTQVNKKKKKFLLPIIGSFLKLEVLETHAWLRHKYVVFIPFLPFPYMIVLLSEDSCIMSPEFLYTSSSTMYNLGFLSLL